MMSIFYPSIHKLGWVLTSKEQIHDNVSVIYLQYYRDNRWILINYYYIIYLVFVLMFQCF
jgi:hypothetical protein